MFVPKPLYAWLLLSAVIVLFDATYVLLRPETLRGGKYFSIFAPYEMYIKFDTLYGANSDSFVVIQSWLNIVEAVLLFIAIFLSTRTCLIKQVCGGLLSIVTSAFVFWKTVIFLWYDRDFTTPAVGELTGEALLYYVIPSSLWIIFPLLTIYLVGRRMGAEIVLTANKEKRQ